MMYAMERLMGGQTTPTIAQRLSWRTVMYDWSSKVDASCPLRQSVRDAGLLRLRGL
jgi:hypothetical protein